MKKSVVQIPVACLLLNLIGVKDVTAKTTAGFLTSNSSNVSSLIADQTVKGKVIDEKGEPIAGVNILVKGTPNKGASTNASGEFTINVSNQNVTLIFLLLASLVKK
jgi:hypothetical protein